MEPATRTFSIITVSKGRLEHLKQTLPRMLAQGASEVIVVDYGCPQGTGDYVREHFPAVRVVSVDSDPQFSNWRARNAGAATASADILVFCDADTVMAEKAIAKLAATFPQKSFGFFRRGHTEHFNKAGLRLGANQLKGFHVIPSAAFRQVGGYDELLQGYAAGGDTDIEDRLILIGVSGFALDPALIEDVVQHDNLERMKNHAEPIQVSYAAGMLYRRAKIALMRLTGRSSFPVPLMQKIYNSALQAARKLPANERISISIDVESNRIGMPLQLGFKQAQCKVSIMVEISGNERIARVPD